MPKVISTAIRDAVLAFARENGNPAVHDETGVSTTTIGRWVKSGEVTLNTKNLDAVCRIEEVRAAAAAALLRRPSADSAAWEAISDQFSELLSPAAGWRLVRKLKEMDEIGLLDSKFSVLQGAIDQKINANVEAQAKRKKRKSVAKREIS